MPTTPRGETGNRVSRQSKLLSTVLAVAAAGGALAGGAATASAAVVTTNPNITATANNANVSNVSASCVQSTGDFGVYTVGFRLPALRANESYDIALREKLTGVLRDSRSLVAGQATDDIVLSAASDGHLRVPALRATVNKLVGGVVTATWAVNTTGQCGWNNLADLPVVEDMWYYEENAGRQTYEVTNTSDFVENVHVLATGVFYGTGGYVGSTSQLVKQTVAVAPHSSIRVESTGFLPYGPCGTYTAWTAAGGGLNAPTHTWTSEPRTEEWDLRDSHNGGLNCSSDDDD
jgi:hypothetical protein